jgi:hypothetical protein
MPDIEPLILDLLEWLDKEPRPYFDVMEAWRTSCPRLPVWEDSLDRGFVARERQNATVQLTIKGREFLYKNRPQLSPLTSKGDENKLLSRPSCYSTWPCLFPRASTRP